MSDKKFNYCCNICNFFNNYGGCMNKSEVKNLLYCMFGISDFEEDLIDNETMERVNNFVECDMQDSFYEEICKLETEITFSINCKKNEEILKILKDSIEGEKDLKTLKEIGFEYSFELANVGFKLGYASWYFIIKGNNFNEIKQNICDTIIENEEIEGIYNDTELKEIRRKILNTKENI